MLRICQVKVFSRPKLEVDTSRPSNFARINIFFFSVIIHKFHYKPYS
jgi:hypothetical protein